ncbi:MAG TPA: HEAT repeat domain-containing protein [Prolixibacteraceae bacterium]|nr:HEAT repeat domain-containing protein [Prolixibacteraceae bacterium]
MTLENSQNEHNTILKGLNATNPDIVLDAIDALRALGKTSDIPVLLDLLLKSRNADVKARITGLFSNLKDKETIPMLVNAIQDKKYEEVLQQLVSSCWENGLDYTPYLPVFVDLLIEKDFIIAFEAYTVITNMEKAIDQRLLDVEIEKLDKAMHSTTSEKKALMLDVIDFLPSIGY